MLLASLFVSEGHPFTMQTHVRHLALPFSSLLPVCSWLLLSHGALALTPEDDGLNNPDDSLKFALSVVDGKASYKVTTRTDETVIEASPLGISRSDADFTSGLTLVSAEDPREATENYELLGSKVRVVKSAYRERVYQLRNTVGMRMDLTVRAFRDGIAFRYGFPGQSSQVFQWCDDITGFNLPDNGRVWTQPYQKVAKWAPGYEAEYVNGVPIGTKAPVEEGWSLPLLAETGSRWTLITESGLESSAFGIHLQPAAPGGLYQARLPEDPETFGIGPRAASITLPWVSPWRVIITGKHAGDVVESTLVTDLARPSEIADTSWIQAGAASWSWWSDGASPQDYDKLVPFVDIAAELGWKYSLIDLGWQEMRGGDIGKLTAYAATKGVGILVWYNSGGKHHQVPDAGPCDLVNDPLVREAEFSRIAAMGIKGIKVDFMQSDKQFVIGLYHDILRDAAKHKLVVNFHGATIPRGWERTYPNLLTMEAVRGGEQYWEQAFAEKAHTLNTIYAFTRNAVGPMDYTPTVFTQPVTTNPKIVKNLTTHAHELALLVVFQSGIQHVIESATGLAAQPDFVKEFLQAIPTAWDESRVLAGEPGRLAIIARRSGRTWYVGGINGTDRTIEESLDLSFISENKGQVSLITDSTDPKTSTHQVIDATAGKHIPVKLSPRGGFTAKIALSPDSP